MIELATVRSRHQDGAFELLGGVGEMADAVDKDPNYWVLSIDDDPFLRLGLDSALSQTKDIEFSSAASKADGMQVFVEMWNSSREDTKRKPSLILLDQDRQGGDKGTDLLSDIIDFCGGTPEDSVKVCMLSASQQQRDWGKAFELGAIGWIDKAAVTDLDKFPGRLRDIINNRQVEWEGSQAQYIMRVQQNRDQRPVLTPRMKQILVETARQGDLKAAAAEIGIAYNTARATLGTVFEKLGTRNQASAVATAIHYELITAEECLPVL